MAIRRACVGIIANPASGSDIRRLVAMGAVFGTQEKINIVRRILAGLHAMDIECIYLMPDAYGISHAALHKLPQALAGLAGRAHLLDMPIGNEAGDTRQATQLMAGLGAGCIVVLGGDGTARAAAQSATDVPLLPVSTGTNNVVPYMIEGTVVGLAAAYVARYPAAVPAVTFRSKRLEVFLDGNPPRPGYETAAGAMPDIALVDVAVVATSGRGSGAVWDPDSLREVIVTRGEPWATGMSGLAGFLQPIGPSEPRGLYFRIGAPTVCRVVVPLAPGLITPLGIEEMRELALGNSVTVAGGRRVLALDGERTIELHGDASARIVLTGDGPLFVDVHRAMAAATAAGAFVQWSDR